mmetsp:Transcript_29652/g.51563  ORF Transcript_29652/g.51563 Transcript_29652/m.51563 type:complete len:251 (+) Transcript_29652:236-988(+)
MICCSYYALCNYLYYINCAIVLFFLFVSRGIWLLLLPGKVVRPDALGLQVGLHADHAGLHGRVDVRDGDVRQRADQLRAVQLVVGALGDQDLVLLLHGEVGPGELRVDVLLVERQHLVVADGPRVAEVVDPGELPLGQHQGDGQQVVQDGHAVGDVHHLLVRGDLGDEVPGREVVADGHAHAQHAEGAVDLQHLLNHSLGERVKATIEVGLLIFSETWPTNGMGFVVLEDAASGIQSAVDILFVADVSDV